MIHITVAGTPKPQGSKVLQSATINGKTKSWMRDADSDLKPWRDNVRNQAKQAMQESFLMDGTIFDTAVAVEIVFYMRRPPSISVSRPYPHVRPDIDKLARGVLDALTGVVYKDDGRVVDLAVRKTYADEHSQEGATITVTPYDNSLITTSEVHSTLAKKLKNCKCSKEGH